MSIFDEIHTNEVPLGHVEYSEFVEFVVNQDIRPERPDGDEAPQLTYDSWQLAELCWKKDPLSRPNVGTVCDTMSRLLDNGPGQQVMEVSDTLFLGLPHSISYSIFLSVSTGACTAYRQTS